MSTIIRTIAQYLVRGDAAIFLILLLVSLSANAPMLAPYQLFSDDYAHFALTVTERFARAGVWRMAGGGVAVGLVAFHVYGIAAIVWHALNGYLFYLVGRRAFGSQSFAFFLSVVVTAFPWGYEAIIWAAAFSYMSASTALWIVIYVLLTYEPERTRSYPLAAGLAGLSLLGLMFHEAIFFSLCVAGTIVWARPGLIRRGQAAAIAVSAAPLAGALAWAALYEATKPAVPFESIKAINLSSIFSGIYYQYSNFEVFEVWIYRPLREYALSTVQPVLLGVALVSLAASLVLITIIARRWRRSGDEGESAGRGAMPPLALTVCMLLLLLGATGIYALGGGYSLDARKRYIIVPLLVMAAAAGFWAIKPRIAPRLSWPWQSAAVIGTLCTVGCLTSFLMLSVWYHEMKRVNALADIIAQSRLSGPVRMEWNSKLTDIWPHATRSWGETDAIGQALYDRGVKGVMMNPDASTRIIWDRGTQRWIVRR